MNPDTIPPLVWRELAILALKTNSTDKANFRGVLDQKFYYGLYAKASGGRYVSKTEDKSIWKTFVDLFRANDAKPLAEAFGPQKLPKSIAPASVLNKGLALLQIDGDDDKMARAYEYYNARPLAARFQFVVHSGGGIVLFNRMRRACQEYIHALGDDPKRSVVTQWKVFGEEAQIGRSDSCVAYLAERIESPAVSEVVGHVWQNAKDLIDGQFEAMGMTKIGGAPIWGFNIPAEEKELLVLSQASGGSAGGLMASVLSLAYYYAILEFRYNGIDVVQDALVMKAKEKTKSLVTQLY
jgi:hypothetical protein